MKCLTPRLILRDFTLDDRKYLETFKTNPDQLKFMMFSLASDKEIDTFLELALTQQTLEKPMEYHWAVECRESGSFLGSVDLMIEAEAPTSAELGYWFGQEAWGRGYGTEAARAMVRFGFENLGLHRVWGKCHVMNKGSARIMEKCGMALEGTVREHLWLRDHYRSSYLYSILEGEWKTLGEKTS